MILRTLRTDDTTRRALLVGAAVVLFTLAFPPFGYGLLGFVALVPLHFAVRRTTLRSAALLGGAFGLVSCFAIFGWALEMPGFRLHHALVLAAYLAIYPAVLSVAWSRLADHALAVPLLPAIVILLDWLRGHLGFLAFPMGTLGQTQHDNLLLLQLASVGGEPLVTFVVVSVNVAIAQVASRVSIRCPAVVLAVAAACHPLGALLCPTGEGRSLAVSAVQPDFIPRARRSDEVVVLDQLTREASAAGSALVVWPESVGGDVENDLLSRFRARAVVEGANVPVLVGSSSSAGATKGTNSLLLFVPDQPASAPYRKVRLVPFIETMPDIIAPLTHAKPIFDTAAGSSRETIALGDVAIEPLICFESLFADDVRRTASSDPSIIALAVNDGWFGKTAAAKMHNLVSAFRAVENRRPVVIASNRGPSQIIDASGRVVARARSFTPGVVTATVRIDAPPGPYRRWGDGPFFALVLFVCGALSLPRLRPRARPVRAWLISQFMDREAGSNPRGSLRGDTRDRGVGEARVVDHLSNAHRDWKFDARFAVIEGALGRHLDCNLDLHLSPSRARLFVARFEPKDAIHVDALVCARRALVCRELCCRWLRQRRMGR